MAFGLEVRDSLGSVLFDSTSVTWLQLGFFNIDAAGVITGTTVFPGAEQFTDIELHKFFINTPPDDQEAFSHSFTITTNPSDVTVTVAVGNTGNQQQGVLVLGR